ncbi:DASH complex subunit spc19 [Emydomyces testavorans]|uniref:DASH complex subunit SPC19 n=1 Tax=Emydomyces testavorans TaxID=2070801 RepID=A0AAF0IK36_9EURO|nr:DASH complex subunit spc19 [Emydomyces testavorans]
MAASLSSSVSSLKSSLQLLESSIDILDEGVNDFPRLCKVLQSTRVGGIYHRFITNCHSNYVVIKTNDYCQHFELLPEPTLHEAQKAILDEITPSIAHLLSLASNHIDKLARREEALKAKCNLQEGRLSHHDSRPLSRTGGGSSDRKIGSTPGPSSVRASELRKLVQKKERLKVEAEGKAVEEEYGGTMKMAGMYLVFGGGVELRAKEEVDDVNRQCLGTLKLRSTFSSGAENADLRLSYATGSAAFYEPTESST